MAARSTTTIARRWAEGWRPDVWLFDFDGTLADSVELIMASFRHATARVLGYVPEEAVLRAGIGLPLIEQMRTLDPERAQELYDVYVEHNAAVHDELLRPYPGVDDLLTRLRTDGRRLGVVTSKRRETARLGLRVLGLEGFDVVVGWDDTQTHKPGPEPLLHALELLGASPEDAVYVGDTAWDVRAGRAAGVATVAVLWGVSERAELEAEGPDLLFAQAAEVFA
ncbi:MAG: HAD-IA family hydrolase [Gaiellales bacterium]